jgi:serine/threonine-protein kinase
VTRYRKSVPPHVAAAIGKALEKLPADRFGSAREFSEALQNPSFATTRTDTVVTAFAAATARKSRRAAAMAVAVALLATMIGAWGWLRPHPELAAPVLRYVDGLLTDSLLETPRRDFALSADGYRMAIITGMNPLQAHLLVRERNQLSAASIPGSERAAAPFFSPDGRRVAFFTIVVPGVFHLKTALLDGGPSHTIAERLTAFSGTWEADSFIYVQRAGTPTLSRVREGGGAITPFSALDSSRGETLHRTPKSMHDGRRILFIAVTNDSGPQVAIADLSSGRHRHIGLRAVAAWYATSGHILFVNEAEVLQVVPFDASRERVSGDPEIVAEGFDTGAGLDVDLSAGGTLMYLPSGEATNPDEILWLNRDGTVIPSPMWTADFADLALSPDGKQVAVGIRERGIVEMWIRNIESGTMSRLTFASDGSTSEPTWTIDGSAVTFIQSHQSTSAIHQRRADGSTPASPVTTISGNFEDVTWGPDGQLFVEVTVSGNRDIFSLRPGKDTVLRPVLTSRFSEFDAAVSPDGRWLAYASSESGRSEVYVRPLADPSAVRAQVSVDGGGQPRWSTTGKELYFVQPVRSANAERRTTAITVVEVRPGPAFATSAPRMLFTHSSNISYWGMTPDGKRFVIVTPVSQRGTQRPQVIVVDRWTSELKKTPR